AKSAANRNRLPDHSPRDVRLLPDTRAFRVRRLTGWWSAVALDVAPCHRLVAHLVDRQPARTSAKPRVAVEQLITRGARETVPGDDLANMRRVVEVIELRQTRRVGIRWRVHTNPVHKRVSHAPPPVRSRRAPLG